MILRNVNGLKMQSQYPIGVMHYEPMENNVLVNERTIASFAELTQKVRRMDYYHKMDNPFHP